jgi:hypothetical protein
MGYKPEMNKDSLPYIHGYSPPSRQERQVFKGFLGDLGVLGGRFCRFVR